MLSLEIFKIADEIIMNSPTILEKNEFKEKLEKTIHSKNFVLSPINKEIMQKIPEKWQSVLDVRKRELIRSGTGNNLSMAMDNDSFFHKAENLLNNNNEFKISFIYEHAGLQNLSYRLELDNLDFNCTEYLPTIITEVRENWDDLGKSNCDGFAPKGGLVFTKSGIEDPISTKLHERFHSGRETIILPLLHELGLETHIDDSIEKGSIFNISLETAWDDFQNELIAYLYGSNEFRPHVDSISPGQKH